jgi:hypothetical protein
MGRPQDLAAHSPGGLLDHAAQPAGEARTTASASGGQGPPPVSTDTAPTGMTSAMAPARSDDPALHPALRQMLEATALIREHRPTEWPSAAAASPDDPAARPGRGLQSDTSAPLSRVEVEAGRYQIRQQELEALHELNRRLKQLEADRDELRQGIIARLKAKGEIEPGRLEATCRETYQCRPSLTNLEELFGEGFVRDHRARIRPTRAVTLTIRERGEGGEP